MIHDIVTRGDLDAIASYDDETGIVQYVLENYNYCWHGQCIVEPELVETEKKTIVYVSFVSGQCTSLFDDIDQENEWWSRDEMLHHNGLLVQQTHDQIVRSFFDIDGRSIVELIDGDKLLNTTVKDLTHKIFHKVIQKSIFEEAGLFINVFGLPNDIVHRLIDLTM